MRFCLRAPLLVASLLPFVAAGAAASTVTLSTASSGDTLADVLDATLDFTTPGGDTLQLVVTNDTTAPNEFNINQVFFNASDSVTSLGLLSAQHSDVNAGIGGDVTADWSLGLDDPVAGFGTFDFALIEGVGETNPSVVGPAESVTFLLSITGLCAGTTSCDMTDFATPNADGFTVAAKFVNGPADDSDFGAVPEPGTGLLLGFGLLALARRRRT